MKRSVPQIFVFKGLQLFRQFFGTLLDLIFPPICHLCHHRLEDSFQIVCTPCWNALPLAESEVVQFRHKKLPDSLALPARSLWQFEGATPQIIHMFKYEGYTKLARVMGSRMAQVVLDAEKFAGADCCIPVPLHPIRERERTYNQSHLLCDEISKITKQPVLNGVLIRTKHTRTQTQLSAEARLSNVQNAFRVISPEKIRGKSIILVDDVLTTGATLTICAQQLIAAGASRVQILTAARA